MKKELKKIVGLSLDAWNNHLNKKNNDFSNVFYEEVRLIPTEKMGDEKALSSIFLSSLKLVDEFRDRLFKEIGLKKVNPISKSYELKVYREVALTEKLLGSSDKENSILDGLVLIIKKGTIIDAAIFEMKNKNNFLNEKQMKKYKELAQKFKIPKIVTISNELVSSSENNPLNFKSNRLVTFVHFSWNYILTQAKLLLFKEKRIEDEDQVAIMDEIVKYFEDERSNILDFSNMGDSWTKIQKSLSRNSSLSPEDLEKVSISWIQEERDMALKLSETLGELVRIKNPRSIKNQKDKITHLIDCLKSTTPQLYSLLHVKNAVSDIQITVDLKTKTVQLEILGKPKKSNASSLQKFKSLFSQLDNSKELGSIKDNLLIEPRIKHKKINEKYPLTFFSKERILSLYSKEELVDFRICYSKNINFGTRKFTKGVENMLFDFYRIIVSNLRHPDPEKVPKIQEKKAEFIEQDKKENI